MGTQPCSILSSGDVSRGPRMKQLPDPGQRTEGPRGCAPTHSVSRSPELECARVGGRERRT